MSEQDQRVVCLIYVWPSQRGAGGHRAEWMAYYEGEEHDGLAARGWGVSQGEAKGNLALARRRSRQ